MPEPDSKTPRDKAPTEPELNIRRMALLFLNAMVFIKVPLLYFGFRMSEDPSLFNVAGFIFFLGFSLFSLVWFVVR